MREQKCVEMLLSMQIVWISKQMCLAFCMDICVFEWPEERGLCVENSLLF